MRTMVLCLAVASVASFPFSMAMAADSKDPAFTDAKSAGIEFELQGEYVGEIQRENSKQKLGVQVIALGDGKFRAMGLIGGLPGEGWARGGEVRMSEAQMENGNPW